MNHDVPVQSLIDHIKTATDVDPWAKEMAEELLKKQEPVKPNPVHNSARWFACGKCDCSITMEDKFCPRCGRPVKWE